MPKFPCSVVAVALFLLCPVAQGSIVSTTSTIVVIPPPPDARTGHLEADQRIRAFAEQQHITLDHGVAVDITLPGTSPAGGVPNLTPSTIAAGTLINSYFLHFDDVGAPANPVAINATIAFSDDILGIAVVAATLNASDPYPGLPTTIYATNDAFRGLELNGGDGPDLITLSADRRSITLDLQNVNHSDDIRIITASAVPEPSSLVLSITAGVVLLLTIGRLRRAPGTSSRACAGRTRG